MNTYFLKGTENTPTIDFNLDTGVLEISGKSQVDELEESWNFFNPLLDKLKLYSLAPKVSTAVHLKLETMDNVSHKYILDILEILENVRNTRVYWYNKTEDEDMQEAGQEFSDLIEIPFEFITLP